MSIDFHALSLKGESADILDLEAAKASLARFDDQFSRIEAEAKSLMVETEDQNNLAVEMACQAKKLSKTINNTRDRFVEKPNDYVKSVRSLAKSYTDRLDKIVKVLKEKTTSWDSARELARRKAEEIARKAAAEAQARLDAEAKKAHVEPVKIQAPVVEKPKKVTRTAEGSAYTRKDWKCEVVDESQLPREYLMADEKKIKAAVKNGIREIPGVRIWEETSTSIRI